MGHLSLLCFLLFRLVGMWGPYQGRICYYSCHFLPFCLTKNKPLCPFIISQKKKKKKHWMGEEATANAFSILVSMQYYIFLVSQPDSSCFLITQVPCQVSWHKHVHEAGNTTNTGFTSSPYTRFTTLCYTTNDIFVTHLKLHCFVLREISNKPEKKKKPPYAAS